MLTRLIQSSEASLFLIDEPDIYLHSDLQRQLLSLLRNLGPDILIATHSTEIVTEAETDDIVLINKRRATAQRIRHPSQFQQVFSALGSNLNPVLTQLAKTRRVLFVEGRDFQILGKFARKLGLNGVGNRSEFAVVPVEGFNPERIRSLKLGMETTLGGEILASAILDRDYRSEAECTLVAERCISFCDHVAIYKRKEIENFLLIGAAIDRACARKVSDQIKRTGQEVRRDFDAMAILEEFARQKKSFAAAQYVSSRRRFERSIASTKSDETIAEEAISEFEVCWSTVESRLAIIPGKEPLSALNQHLQDQYGISVTPTAIIDAMHTAEIPDEMQNLMRDISRFASSRIR
jgi:predicted ATP-dependent endonuclease of OLD family